MVLSPFVSDSTAPLSSPDRRQAGARSDLNRDQQRTVEAVAGPVVVYAGPGSGKTRVVTHRIANQVAHGVPPSSVVAVTFTDKAAIELLARLRGLGVPAATRGGVRASTFHSAALRQVGYFWPRLTGGPALDVLASKLALLVPLARRGARLLAAVAPADLAAEVEWIKARGAALPGVSTEDSGLPRHLATLNLGESAPRWQLDADAYRIALAEHDGPWPDDVEDGEAASEFARLFDRYEEDKASRGQVDFEDMLAVATALIATDDEVAAAVRRQFTHFTVDEFQDVNRLQWDLLNSWTGARDDV